MTSGEWDLRALKALEEEEQKEFLALSQKNLFEPPSPPKQKQQSSPVIPASSSQHQHQHQHQQLHGSLQPTYASQFQPQLLKLPTINECNLITKRHSATRQDHALLGTGVGGNGIGGVDSRTTTSGRLKFTRALSLSAHSLSGGRGAANISSDVDGGGSANGSSSIFGGGTGSGLLANLGRRAKAKFALTKSSGSLSTSQYSNSPVYTPPPIRRCATLHHTQPVRKAFKTLQQLEKQRQERKKTEAERVAVVFNNTLTRHKSPQLQLQRVAGTNKTYWKYGANSTAASIIGQRTQQQKQQQQQQLEQQSVYFRKPCATAATAAESLSVELELNTSDDNGDSENAAVNIGNLHNNNNTRNSNNNINLIGNISQNNSININVNSKSKSNSNNNNDDDDADADMLYYDDSATETGSCTVPLATDSIEMMRLMLTAAKTAVTTAQHQPVMLPTTLPSASGSASAGVGTSITTLGYSNLKQRIPTPDIANATEMSATSGSGLDDDYEQEQQKYQKHHGSGSTYNSAGATSFVMSTRRYQQQSKQHHRQQQQQQQQHQQQQPLLDPNETVAYKAFHALARRKSFSGGGAGVSRYGETMLCTAVGNSGRPQVNRTFTGEDNSGRRLLKSSSVETPASTVEYNSSGNLVASGSGGGGGGGGDIIMASKFIGGVGIQRSTIITNPIVEGIKSATATATGGGVGGGVTVTASPMTLNSRNHMCNFVKENTGRGTLQQQRQIQQQHTAAGTASLLCHELINGSPSPLISPSGSSPPVIDDELEQHIKHCSCSCNHMGYGNSMDYQLQCKMTSTIRIKTLDHKIIEIDWDIARYSKTISMMMDICFDRNIDLQSVVIPFRDWVHSKEMNLILTWLNHHHEEQQLYLQQQQQLQQEQEHQEQQHEHQHQQQQQHFQSESIMQCCNIETAGGDGHKGDTEAIIELIAEKGNFDKGGGEASSPVDPNNAWNIKFINDMDQSTFMDFIVTVNYLNIEQLLEFLCKVIADMVVDKTYEEVCKACTPKLQLSSDEIEYLYNENPCLLIEQCDEEDSYLTLDDEYDLPPEVEDEYGYVGDDFSADDFQCSSGSSDRTDETTHHNVHTKKIYLAPYETSKQKKD